MGTHKEPAWREQFSDPDVMIRPIGMGMKARPPVPGYVHRWLTIEAGRGKSGRSRDQLVSELLVDACRAFYEAAPPPIFVPLRGYQPPDNTFLRSIYDRRYVGITNGSYGWLFALDESPETKTRFLSWVSGEWVLDIRRIDWRQWPLVQVAKGSWPIDPRLLPGTPLALPQMIGRMAS